MPEQLSGYDIGFIAGLEKALEVLSKRKPDEEPIYVVGRAVAEAKRDLGIDPNKTQA